MEKFGKFSGKFHEMFSDPVYLEACEVHGGNKTQRPGKLGISPTRTLLTQHDLGVLYSPGVAAPCYAIYENPEMAYDFTSKGNTVAVVSDGSATLGLGNIGALASLPVMEGKSVLFKKFADIDSIPIIVGTQDVHEFVDAVKRVSLGWGGINLEDISGPRCFEIEKLLSEALDIPVFHDDQHGTAIVTGAGLINALKINGKNIADIKMLVNGAGAAGIACLKFFITLGVNPKNIILCDRAGVIYKGRDNEMDPIKGAFAQDTHLRTLAEAIKGMDVFMGLSAAHALKPEMLETMAESPIVFALANPEPEIRPEVAKTTRPDVIIATGRSDYSNQVNNVLGFPYIFRGALDVRARKINDEMKLAAAYELAALAREPIHGDAISAYAGRNFKFGRDYIIPVPFDPRLLPRISAAVAKAAIESKVARKPITDFEEYKVDLSSKLDPSIRPFQAIVEKLRQEPKRVIFAEGEEEAAIRAASLWTTITGGTAILVGDKPTVESKIQKIGLESSSIEIINSAVCNPERIKEYIDASYAKLQRKGKLMRDSRREVKTDRNVFASNMLTFGDGDAMITGLTRSYRSTLEILMNNIEHEELVFGVSIVISNNKVIFITDTVGVKDLSPDDMVQVATRAARIAESFGLKPRVAFISSSNFGSNKSANPITKEAVKIMEKLNPEFEFDGEMFLRVALGKDISKNYPFSRLKGPANVLVMPNLEAALSAQDALGTAHGSTVLGPLLMGFKHPVQIASLNSTTSEIVNIVNLALSGYCGGF